MITFHILGRRKLTNWEERLFHKVGNPYFPKVDICHIGI